MPPHDGTAAIEVLRAAAEQHTTHVPYYPLGGFPPLRTRIVNDRSST
ncbi:hypothetical protein LWP59_26315 [Amycolatopsis acidiphila]|nr:hypothetical protein [Amycolatopsis acidiphila]UIJ57644.1 hypothetical protein LWP59_26315 [Amycolatopsis acidiphila]GHG90045.1 hypothetical protein GCM10017788_65240 [Amycolatopsis acidiphila]